MWLGIIFQDGRFVELVNIQADDKKQADAMVSQYVQAQNREIESNSFTGEVFDGNNLEVLTTLRSNVNHQESVEKLLPLPHKVRLKNDAGLFKKGEEGICIAYFLGNSLMPRIVIGNRVDDLYPWDIEPLGEIE